MCNTWQFPSSTSEEFDLELLNKLPGGMQRLNITGGEPMLRKDIKDIVRILNTKTNRLEISSNGRFDRKSGTDHDCFISPPFHPLRK